MLRTLYYEYFLCNLNSYIGVDFPISAVLFWLMLGLILATFFVHFKDKSIHHALRRLHKHGCLDPESAQTVEELKLTKRHAILYMLKNQSMLTHYVRRVGEEEYTYESYLENKKAPLPKVDLKSARFYLDPSFFPRAKGIIDRGEQPISKPILSSVLFLVIYLIVLFTMPSILNLLF